MAAPATPFLLMLLVLIGGGLALLPTSSVAADMPMPVNEEVLGLVVFKSALSDPSGKLASWTESDATPCGWPCVECDPSTSRVLRLALDGPLPVWPNAAGPGPPHRPSRTSPWPATTSPAHSLRASPSSSPSGRWTSPTTPSPARSPTTSQCWGPSDTSTSPPTPSRVPCPFSDLPSSLRFLMLSDNQFAGPLPKGLAAQSALLLHLNVSGNQLTGSPDFSGALWTLSRLRALDIVPQPVRRARPVPDGVPGCTTSRRWTSAATGSSAACPGTSACCPHLAAVDLSNNAFDGHLPDSIAQLSSLVRFSASGNRLSGDVPAWLGKLTALQRLDLSGNAFTGSLPESIGDLKALSYLGLSDNQLSGSVPDSILSGGCSRLAELHLRGNNLTGTIVIPPPDVASYPETLLIAVAGPVGKPAHRRHPRRDVVVVQDDELDGNSLSGPIPDTIGKCSSLYLLSLGHNGLTGPIPAGVSELKKLEILRLEYNNLSGEIPAQLATLDNLLAVNISHNRLVGRLPSSGVFQSLDATALEGNLGICSPLVSEPCRMNVPKPLVLDPNEYNTHSGGTDNNNNNGDNNLETTANGGVPRKRRVLSVSAMVAICAAVVIVVGVGVITLLNMSAARRHKELPTEKDKGEKNRSTKEELESGGGVSNNYSGSSSSSTTKTKNKHNKKLATGGKVVTFGAAGSLRSEDLLLAGRPRC
ncbi:hypothetical protein PR202_ga08261 [Eleusine coracana subsp. coracana]|uniref:Leucine-rich repeat-containing N-terminal plant-type domain-containing protein n=1 Tax=Eleusine coracana subsp. coracana TaxID=191504 RepID=A0AAV5BZP6_ELECO|nr:hypothetical protein PR202_ga08261 [Eleusine coracana subsp. coracana]